MKRLPAPIASIQLIRIEHRARADDRPFDPATSALIASSAEGSARSLPAPAVLPHEALRQPRPA